MGHQGPYYSLGLSDTSASDGHHYHKGTFQVEAHDGVGRMTPVQASILYH